MAALGLAALLLAAAGCSGRTYEGSTGATPANRTFTYVASTEVMTEWDPAPSYSNEIIAMSNMYETLTRYDSKTQQVRPLLATTWKSSSDGMSWTFTLRDGVKFHTGRPVTAEAAKAAILRTKKLGAGAGYIWGAVKSIDTPDARTLEFTLDYPAPLDLISSAGYAAYIYDTQATGSGKAPASFAGTDAGTGPYTVEKWDKGQETELILKKFDGYWRGWEGPKFDRVAYRVVPEANTAAQLLRDRSVDFVQDLPPNLWQTFQNSKEITATQQSSWQNLFALLNTQKGALKDKRVRQAIAAGVDYDGIYAALRGAQVSSSGIVPAGLLGHSTDLPLPAYDQDEAGRLLSAAGYGPGKKKITLELTYLQGDANEKLIATLMKSQLAQLNIDLKPRGLPWESAQWPRAKSADPSKRQDILIMYWWPDYADPWSYFGSMFKTEKEISFNLAYYSNRKLDGQIDEVGAVAATDREKAARMYHDMQVTLLEETPTLLFGTKNYMRGHRSDLSGYVDNPAYANVAFVYELTPR